VLLTGTKLRAVPRIIRRSKKNKDEERAHGACAESLGSWNGERGHSGTNGSFPIRVASPEVRAPLVAVKDPPVVRRTTRKWDAARRRQRAHSFLERAGKATSGALDESVIGVPLGRTERNGLRFVGTRFRSSIAGFVSRHRALALRRRELGRRFGAPQGVPARVGPKGPSR
jgi:hypothetical protein